MRSAHVEGIISQRPLPSTSAANASCGPAMPSRPRESLEQPRGDEFYRELAIIRLCS